MAGPLVHGQSGDVGAGHEHVALADLDGAHDGAAERGLPGAVGAQHGDDLAGRDIEGEIPQGDHVRRTRRSGRGWTAPVLRCAWPVPAGGRATVRPSPRYTLRTCGSRAISSGVPSAIGSPQSSTRTRSTISRTTRSMCSTSRTVRPVSWIRRIKAIASIQLPPDQAGRDLVEHQHLRVGGQARATSSRLRSRTAREPVTRSPLVSSSHRSSTSSTLRRPARVAPDIAADPHVVAHAQLRERPRHLMGQGDPGTGDAVRRHPVQPDSHRGGSRPGPGGASRRSP